MQKIKKLSSFFGHYYTFLVEPGQVDDCFCRGNYAGNVVIFGSLSKILPVDGETDSLWQPRPGERGSLALAERFAVANVNLAKVMAAFVENLPEHSSRFGYSSGLKRIKLPLFTGVLQCLTPCLPVPRLEQIQ